MQGFLNQLVVQLGEIELIGYINENGGIQTSSGRLPITSDRIGEICFALSTLGETLAGELHQEAMNQISLRFGDEYLLVTPISEGRYVMALTKPNAILGMVFENIKYAIEKIERELVAS